MSYISLVMDLHGYRLVEALFLFPFASLPHPLPDPWGRNFSLLDWDLAVVPSVRADQIQVPVATGLL